MKRTDLFTAIRPYAPGLRYTNGQTMAIDALADSFGLPRLDADPLGPLTARGAAELVGHEAIVPEWYLDSENVGTWSVGITKASGINVIQYKDNPQPIDVCLRAFFGRLTAVYIPDVLEAFGTKALSEAQFAAALSFHYNTGAIERADWVKLWLAGKVAEAKVAFMNWRSPASIIERRTKERDLFFDGKWSGDGTCLVYAVSKPSYKPGKATRVDIRADIAKALAT